jgi:D-beta-D-heptose 7-phosphate kinase / D-beta-D-heptose 1-phosphate adenosyltransferase
MTAPPIVIVGDTLLDRDIEGRVSRVCPDSPAPVCDVVSETARPGGAGLAALLAAAHGPVTLVTALADDDGGQLLRHRFEAAGVELLAMRLSGATPEKVRVRTAAQTLLRIDRAATPGGIEPAPPDVLRRVQDASAVLAADYGRGLLDSEAMRAALGRRRTRRAVAWDPHPRGGAPVARCTLVTPNGAEAALASGLPGDDAVAAVAQGRVLAAKWRAEGVAVTLGAAGAVLVGRGGAPLYVATTSEPGDTCGAGDRFATAATQALAAGALISEAVEHAVSAAASYVRSGGVAAVGAVGLPATVDPSTSVNAAALAERVRAAGGTCVATGGCFDLLHAGHVSMLQAARRLGDCLIVCLNSDASVRRLKGDGRPRQSASDRAAVLSALDCVDAVAIFDEDTPVDLLRRLRPHVFAKGADYDVTELPEAEALRAWGGQAIALPYLAGRSTTRLLLEEIVSDAN